MTTIHRVTVNGRPGSACFVNDKFSPVDEKDAVLYKIVFDDGGQLILNAKPPTLPKPPTPPTKSVRAFDPSQPRDEGGKWTEGGGDGGGGSTGGGGDKRPAGAKHPGPGYSAAAHVDSKGVIHTSSVYDAARALGENRKVNLDQPRTASVLLNHLGQVSKNMIAMGQKAPLFNLCNVTISGTNLFCVESHGIPRVEMPQLDVEQTKAFRRYLKEQGYTVEKESTLAANLRATQNELNGVKVAANAEKLRARGGELPRIIVSKDDYILDGHHRWAAKVGLDAEDNNLKDDTKVKIARVNISITKLLEEAEKFTGGKGKKPANETASYRPATKVFDDDDGIYGGEEPAKSRSFSQTLSALHSSGMLGALGVANLVDLKLRALATNRAAMVWSNGRGSPAIFVRTTARTVEATTAIKTHAVRMPAVIFKPVRDGAHFMASFTVADDPRRLHNAMQQVHLDAYILEAIKDATVRVFIFGDDQETIDAIEKVANGRPVKIIAGRLEVLREVADAGVLAGRDLGEIWRSVLDYRRERAFDPSQPRDESGKWTDGGGSDGGGGSGDAGGARGSGARSPEQAQARAAKAAAGHPKLDGLPDKPLKIGGEYYVPGPLGKAKEVAEKYMRSAGMSYRPPQTYQKVDKARAARVADEFDKMKHDPDNPQVKASYEALARETIAQWHAIRDAGLKVEWIKPGQEDPYAATPRLAAMDVIDNNHWWGFPTDAGFGTGAEAEAAKHNNPMLQMTDEVVDGRRLMVNDVFRIVHDYFGHFKEGSGFRADGEENAWRSHASMYSDLARGAMTSETRGQNSWVNYGPNGEANRTASAADTVYAPQKIGLMPEWTHNEGREDAAAPPAAVDPTSASALAKPVTVSVDEVIASVPGSKEKIAAAKQKLAAGVRTDAPVENGGYKQADGSWTPERAAMHEKMLADIFTPEMIAASTPKAGERPVVHLLGGRGGSGKSWFTGPKGTIDKSGAIYLNNDDIKSALPEYQGWNAALLHEESSYIGNAAETIAMEIRANIVIDGTMRTAKSLEERVAAFKAAGYRVEGHYMYTSPQHSAERALGRFVSGGETGRFVPPEYSLSSTTNEAAFDAVKDEMDRWEIFDNDGAAPKFHARGGK